MKAIDLFAGAGGWTEGATQAGVTVVAAANHWAKAVASHELNHPNTIHHCQDLNLFDPGDYPAHDLMLASPSCQGHSPARRRDLFGAEARHDKSRATAWCVVDTAEICRPKALIVENIPAFYKWALYPQWKASLEALGYHLREHVLDAADFGVPQNRERAIITGCLSRPIQIGSGRVEWVAASSFLRFDKGNWSPINKPSRAQATLDRIATGRRQLGTGRFLAPYYSEGSGLTGRSIDRPIGTVTTLDRFLLVDGDRCRCLMVEEYKAAQSFRADYKLTGNRRDQIMQLGNAVPPLLAAHCVRQVREALAA